MPKIVSQLFFNSQVSQELAEKVDCYYKTLLNYLQAMGHCLAYELSLNLVKELKMTGPLLVLLCYHVLLSQHRPFLSLTVTRDEK